MIFGAFTTATIGLANSLKNTEVNINPQNYSLNRCFYTLYFSNSHDFVVFMLSLNNMSSWCKQHLIWNLILQDWNTLNLWLCFLKMTHTKKYSCHAYLIWKSNSCISDKILFQRWRIFRTMSLTLQNLNLWSKITDYFKIQLKSVSKVCGHL